MSKDTPEEIISLWTDFLKSNPECKVVVEVPTKTGDFRIKWTSLELFKDYYKHWLVPQPEKQVSTLVVCWNFIQDKDIPVDGNQRTIACYDTNTGCSYTKQIFCNKANVEKEETAYAWTDFVLLPPPVQMTQHTKKKLTQ